MDYLVKKLYIPLIAVGLSLSSPSCISYKNIEEAYDWCIGKEEKIKVITKEGKLTCKEINEIYESEAE